MSTNKTLAMRWMDETWNAKVETAMNELLSPEAVGYLEGRTIRGVAEFDAFRREYIAAFPDTRMTIEDIVGEGDLVAMRWRVSGKHQGKLHTCEATGKCVEMTGTTWLRFRDGKIVEGHDTWNQGALMATLMQQ